MSPTCAQCPDFCFQATRNLFKCQICRGILTSFELLYDLLVVQHVVYAAHDALHVVATPVDDWGHLQLCVNTLLHDRLEEVNPLDLNVLQFADDQTQLPVVVVVLVPVGLDQLLSIKPPVILILSCFCLTGNKMLSCLYIQLENFFLAELDCNKLKHLKSEAFYSIFCPHWNM